MDYRNLENKIQLNSEDIEKFRNPSLKLLAAVASCIRQPPQLIDPELNSIREKVLLLKTPSYDPETRKTAAFVWSKLKS